MIGLIKKLFGANSDSSAPDSVAGESRPARDKAAGTDGDYSGFVTYVVKRLVSNPDAVRLERVEEQDVVTLKIHCEKGDVPKVIGKRGRTISSIRILVNGAATRDGHQVRVDVVD